ncbi:hypothetical protein MKW92_013551 [Papaver armeniacum]|nr:hypothetical protein MKW92_013551 [Papaver armeniacum]
MVFSSLLCESELLFRFLLYKIVLTQQTVFIQKKQQEHELYIVFNFETGQHDLAEVSKEEFDNCTTTNQTSIIRQGPANINLTSICPHYFICTIGKHCQFGQKLTINVTDDSATKTPSGLPPTTATAPMPTTPGNSASHTSTGSFVLVLLFISTILLH